MILNVAAGGLVSNFRPVLAALEDRFGLQAVDPYFGRKLLQLPLSWSCLGFNSTSTLVAFLTNLVLVIFRKLTLRVRTVFITIVTSWCNNLLTTWLIFCFSDNVNQLQL